MESIGKIEVPFVGPPESSLWLCGEAPGKEEILQGEPFVGLSGQLQDRFLERHGITRREPHFCNLSKYRPKKNMFRYLLDSPQLQEGVDDLKIQLSLNRPNVIVALGAWPLYYLTGRTGKQGKPGTGILNWRGSVLPCTLVDGLKVVASVHPAYVLRDYGFHPIYYQDLGRAVHQSTFPDIRYPQYESIIDPPRDILYSIADEMSQAEWLSVDIETFGDKLACIGFADSAERGLCLTYNSVTSWEIARELLTSNAKKIFQYGTFDVSYLDHFYGWKVDNIGWDTYIATANLLPEFRRGLHFTTSIYTDFPYYKDEGRSVLKTWKETKSFADLNTLWEYNIKDIVATYMIAMKQMKEMEELYG